MRPNIIIIGANGMLGNTVVKYFNSLEKYDITPLTSKEFNILTDPLESFTKILKNNTIVVINCAGIIKPRINTLVVEDVFKINSLFPVQLGKLLNNIKIIHISTDCVFTGNSGPYNEKDVPDATDIYGMSKILGEECQYNALVVRTSIIGEELNNKYSLLEWAKSETGNEVQGWTDHIWSGVTTLQLAKFISKLLTQDFFKNGLIHYAGIPIDKYELLNIINDVYNLKLKIKKTTSIKACNRSLIMSSDYKIPDLQQQLQELQTFFKNDT